jgi:hypothetical protein
MARREARGSRAAPRAWVVAPARAVRGARQAGPAPIGSARRAAEPVLPLRGRSALATLATAHPPRRGVRATRPVLPARKDRVPVIGARAPQRRVIAARAGPALAARALAQPRAIERRAPAPRARGGQVLTAAPLRLRAARPPHAERRSGPAPNATGDASRRRAVGTVPGRGGTVRRLPGEIARVRLVNKTQMPRPSSGPFRARSVARPRQVVTSGPAHRGRHVRRLPAPVHSALRPGLRRLSGVALLRAPTTGLLRHLFGEAQAVRACR